MSSTLVGNVKVYPRRVKFEGNFKASKIISINIIE